MRVLILDFLPAVKVFLAMNGLDLRFSIPKFKVETPVKTIRISLSEETTLVLNKKRP